MGLEKFLPAWSWLADYNRNTFFADLNAGIITAILLVPQGMAYAILAGLPPEVGLYASIVPPVVYALFGTSRTLSVGPVSVAAIMVASALSRPEFQDNYLQNALVLAFESGLILLALGVFRFGVLVNFLSHPVLSGFTSGAAIMIILSQLGNLSGIQLPRGIGPMEMLTQLYEGLAMLNLFTLAIGVVSIAVLLSCSRYLQNFLTNIGLSGSVAIGLSKAGPLLVVLAGTVLVVMFQLDVTQSVSIVGSIPAGLPVPDLNFLQTANWLALLPSSALIGLIGYVESVSVARVLAQRHRQRIDVNQELLALGAANTAAAVAGTMPVAGGFSRTMVNYSAGAKTQLAAVITATLVAVAAVVFTPLFSSMPKAALAAVIIVAVSTLVDVSGARQVWHYDRIDGSVLLATFSGVLLAGIETGLIFGVFLSLSLHIWRTGRPHIAEVGRLPGTAHFRNVNRHKVQTWDHVLMIRIDESLYFANAGYVESFLMEKLHRLPEVRELVLICSAVNTIDSSALEILEGLVQSSRAAGITVHLAEVKGPVMDRLKDSELLAEMKPGQVFLSTEEAVQALT